MIKLCFGTYAKIIKATTTLNTNEAVIYALFGCGYKHELNIDTGDQSRLINSKLDLDYIKESHKSAEVYDAAPSYFQAHITPKRIPAKVNTLLADLVALINSDGSIPASDKSTFLALANINNLHDFLAKVYMYAVLQTNDLTVASPLRSADMEAAEELVPTVATAISSTLIDKGFDGVFLPVACSLKNVGLFHLADIKNNAFKYDDLKSFLRRNVGRYILSRAKIDKMLNDGDADLIGAEALEMLRVAGGFDEDKISEELGDLILYVFLEKVLNAPKLYSKIQINDGTKPVNQGGVHLLRLDSTVESYQLVIGKSNIVGDLKTAIDNAFMAIVTAQKNEGKERKILESTMPQSFSDPAELEYVRGIIFPTDPEKEKTPASKYHFAFGVFLGYSLGVEKAGKTDEQFRSELIAKMQADIQSQTAYIAEKIKVHDLEGYEFYFYLLPFNNADGDKLSIMKFLLGGDSI